jgi:hypothetical protein
MNKLLLLIGLLMGIALPNIIAQSGEGFTVTGKVLDAQTLAPLPSASVFAQNTTFGTATDQQGQFSLKLPAGGYDLVISYTGYDVETKRIRTADGKEPILITVKAKDQSMTEVAIVASNEVKDGLARYGSFFLDQFLGRTSNRMNCTLQNPDALKFFYSKRKNRLKVTAAAPLQIRNESLGYQITYTLDSFTYEYGAQLATYSGYPLFEPLRPANETQAAQWENKRQEAYSGSILHFMRSVYQKQLKEQGYELQFVAQTPQGETAIPLKNLYGGLNYRLADSSAVVEITPNQNLVAILFHKEKPDPNYLTENEEPETKYQLSFLQFPDNQAIALERNGYYFDQNDLIITGYWSWEKVADLLPYDYLPRQ